MPKRKRDSEIEDEISAIPDQALRIRVSRFKARFDHGVVQLTAQLKLARGFDRQKMTRRIKQAGTDEAKLSRLSAEVKFLNELNEGKLARSHLVKQCVKTKRIAESDAFLALFGDDAEAKVKGKVTTLEEGNVLGRLFKAKVVIEVLPEIMKGFRDVLGVDRPRVPKLSTAPGAENSIGRTQITSTTEDDQSTSYSDFDGFSDMSIHLPLDDLTTNDAHSVGSTEDDLAVYDSRLAASSDNEDVDDIEIPHLTSSLTRQKYSNPDDMEITSDEDSDQSFDSQSDQSLPDAGSNEDLTPPPKRGASTTKTTKPILTTSFLPSLMHGGYYSGSDTDTDTDLPQTGDYDPDKSFAASEKEQRERKNRRGQRERQAIAEKKFGVKAKHLVRARGAEGVHGDRQRLIQGEGRPQGSSKPGSGSRDGWDARRGAVESRPRQGPSEKRERVKKPTVGAKPRGPNRFERRNGFAKGKDHSGKGEANGGASSGANAETVSGKPRLLPKSRAALTGSSVGGEKLHPSWEAARKKKLESASGVASFVGKKITFD